MVSPVLSCIDVHTWNLSKLSPNLFFTTQLPSLLGILAKLMLKLQLLCNPRHLQLCKFSIGLSSLGSSNPRGITDLSRRNLILGANRPGEAGVVKKLHCSLTDSITGDLPPESLRRSHT